MLFTRYEDGGNMIKSGLDLHRELPSPQLESGEKVIRKCTGTLDTGRAAFSTFRPCNIYLTDRRLLLAQVRKVIKDFRYSTIRELTVVKRKWLAGKMVPQLQITLKDGKVHFVVMNEPWVWLADMAGFGEMNIKQQIDESAPISLPEKISDEKKSLRGQKKGKVRQHRGVKRRS